MQVTGLFLGTSNKPAAGDLGDLDDKTLARESAMTLWS